MNMPKVTIIIPTYNVEKYISKGIKSCKEQTYKNIEVIIVDDGSNDNTRNIIKKCCDNDERFRYYFKKNDGVSSARNYALDFVTGEYLIFLDSDDWLNIDTIEILVKYAKKYDEYFIICSRNIINENSRKLCNDDNRNKIEIVTRENALCKFDYRCFYFQSSCYKLFNTNIVKLNKLKFCEDIYYGEDGLFVFQYLHFINNIVSIPKPLWNILDRNTSATNIPFNSKKLTLILAAERMLNNTLSNKVKQKISKYLIGRIESLLIEALKDGINKNKESILYIKEKLKKYKYFIKCYKFSYIEIIMYIILLYFPERLAVIIIKIKIILKNLKKLSMIEKER